MIPFFCVHEEELLVLVERGQWPQAAPSELRAHVAACRCCSELVSVKQALEASRATLCAMPVLPSAGAVWWRAQIRRRHADLERIGRPLLGAQIFALAVFLTLAAGGLAWQARRGLHLGAWFEALHLDWFWSASIASFTGKFGMVVLLLAMLALISGVVVYFASEKQER
jgi:hypothetical protein